MSGSGPDLVLHHTRSQLPGVPAPGPPTHHMGHAGMEQGGGQLHLPPPPPSHGVFNNVNSFYSPHHHSGFNLFSPGNYTVHHRGPSGREVVEPGRHPSGGSVGSGGTPPSPDQGSNTAATPLPAYKQNSSIIIDRQTVGSTALSGSSYPRPAQPSPAASTNLPQKSPFDLTTMGMSSKSVGSYSNSGSGSSGSPGLGTGGAAPATTATTPFPRTGHRLPGSPYTSSVNIKQEPGSPAGQPGPGPPHSPRTVAATPPPGSGYPRTARPAPTASQGFNFPSPGQVGHPASPAPATAIGENTATPRPVSSKFRYPSGPQQPSVQNLSPGESTASTSALSSREGTPGPGRQSWPCTPEESAAGGPAPNVDISAVQVKEEFGLGLMRYSDTAHSLSNDYARRPSVNLSYPAATTTVSTPSHMDSYPPHPSYSGYPHPHAGLGPQQLPPRTAFHPMAGRPGLARPTIPLPGNSESSSHSNVKIGRRPAHLPKVLKFSDNTLPHGWIRKLKQRKHGKQAGRWDVYIYSPCGVKFASRKKLRNFFEKNNLQYDPEDFDFTPYGRHIEQSAHARHHSSNENVHRHGSSPGSAASPASSYNSPGLHEGFKSEFLSPGQPAAPPTAHRPHSYIHPAHQAPMFTDYNPMMESPPNASALEVPQHQILNLSQPPPISNAVSRPGPPPPILATSHPAPASNFPPDIATILNEPSDNQFRQSLRDYQAELPGGRGGQPGDPLPTNTQDADTMQVDTENNVNMETEKKEMQGEENRFMTRTYNLLTASQGDLGDMMDEYSIYPE